MSSDRLLAADGRQQGHSSHYMATHAVTWMGINQPGVFNMKMNFSSSQARSVDYPLDPGRPWTQILRSDFQSIPRPYQTASLPSSSINTSSNMPPHPATPKRYQDCKPGYQWYACSTWAGLQYAGCCSLDPCSAGNSCPLANQEGAVIVTTAAPTTTIIPSPTGPNPAVIVLPTTPPIPADTASLATTDGSSSPSVGVIVAASLCSFVGVMVILALWLWLCCLRRKDKGEKRKNDADYSSNASIRGIRGRSPSPYPPPPDDDGSSPSPYPPHQPHDGGGVLSRIWDRSATPRSSASPPASLSREKPRHHRDRTSYSYPDHGGEGVSPMAATYPEILKPDSMDIRLTPLEISSSSAVFRADLVGVNRTPGRSTSVRRSTSETRSGEDRHRTSSRDRRARSSSTRSRQRSQDPWDIKCGIVDSRSRAKFRSDRPRSRVRRSNSTPAPSDSFLPGPFKRSHSESQTLVNNSSRAKDRRSGTIKFTYPSHPTLGIRRSLETQGFLNTAKAEYFYHPRKHVAAKVTALGRLEYPAGRRRFGGGDGPSEPPSSASDMPPVERSWRGKGYTRTDKRDVLFHRPTGQYIHSSRLDGASGTMVETD